MYKKILKGIDAQGKTKLVNTMIKISNGLRKCHIDLRRKFFKQVIDQMGGKLRMVLYGGAKLDKETTIGYDNFGIISIQGYGLTETSPVLTAAPSLTLARRPSSSTFSVLPAVGVI